SGRTRGQPTHGVLAPLPVEVSWRVPPRWATAARFGARSGDAGRQCGLLERVTHGRVGLEGAPEAKLLADLPDGGKHFLAHQPDAPPRILVLHEAVASPEADDGRPCLLEQASHLRDHRLRRAGDDLLVADLILERGAARIRPAPD